MHSPSGVTIGGAAGAAEYLRGGRGRGGGGGYKHEKEGYGTVKCFGNHWHISGPRITFWSEWWSLGQNQMDTLGLGSPNCFVVNVSSLVHRLIRSFCQRANRVIALNRAAILTEYASVEAVRRSYRLLRPLIMTRHGGASPPGSHRECIESSVLWEKMDLTWESMGEVWGDFHFAPNRPRRGGAILSTMSGENLYFRSEELTSDLPSHLHLVY